MQNTLYHGQLARGKPLVVQKTLPLLGPETPYVYVPHALLKDCASYPLAIGVWIIVGRLNKQRRGGVPLSAADLAHYLGYAKHHEAHKPLRTSLMRAIDHLGTLGWLQIDRAIGTKHSLLCTWGQTRRPWNFDEPSTGRPTHVRGVQVPLALCDLYIGSLTPQAGRGSAQVRRYITQPLLDGKDIGVYALARYAVVVATPRLHHLGLADEHGVLAPLSLSAFQTRLQAGQLTTLDDEGNVRAVGPRDQGWAPPERFFSQHSGSTSGSASGSSTANAKTKETTHGKAQHGSEQRALASASMDDPGMIPQQTNSSTTDTGDLLGGDDEPALKKTPTEHPQAPINSAQVAKQSMRDCENLHYPVALDPLIIANHQALNGERVIGVGEWWELVTLVRQHSMEQLLIWQARAARSSSSRPCGVTPAYYIACAGREALATYRPTSTKQSSERRTRNTAQHAPRETFPRAASEQPCAVVPTHGLDPERLHIVADIEAQAGEQIILRHTLDAVPLPVLQAWRDRAVVQHPGLAARFHAPLNFTVGMMRAGRMPPSDRQLAYWQSQRPLTAVDNYAAALRAYEEADRRERERYAEAFAGLYEEQPVASWSDELGNALLDIGADTEQWDWLSLQVEIVQSDDGTHMKCWSNESLYIAREMAGVLGDAVADLDWPLPFTITAVGDMAVRPTWIAPSCWFQLSPQVQHALDGSRRYDDGSLDVHASLYEQLTTKDRAEIQWLVSME